MTTRSSRAGRFSGFTLVELAVVLVIVALLAGGLLVPLSTQFDAGSRSETQRQLSEAKESLYGFAATHGHLPCPAVPGGTGTEDRAGSGPCNRDVGLLPWATLGLPRHDAYGHHFRYSVSNVFSNAQVLFGLSTVGNIRIKTRNGSGTEIDATNGDIVAVILSHGKNGIWGYSDGSQIADVSTTNIDEDVNGNGDGKTFYERTPAPDAFASGGEFDDMLIWIPTSALLSRMVAARKLP
ncbi:MAG TPA: type II secretion system protein [Rhodocyclaceae bacterium]|nr:type II secretion system protein [Rhodocyclaceae bacterium]